MNILLLISVFVIATCGLIYELISGALASYLLGDSITQFSTVIGVYLFAMGIGSYLSKFIDRNLIRTFIQIELLIGVIGGFSAPLLFLSFNLISGFRILLYFLVMLTGIGVGLEIPLLMRILKDNYSFKDLVSKVFTFDYIGALIASLLFPLLLVPHVGLVHSSLVFGLLNVLVGVVAILVFKNSLRHYRLLLIQATLAILALIIGLVFANHLVSFSESLEYDHKIILTRKSTYQRIVLTRSGRDLRLFLNGHLQFSSRDEYRYHEALIHPGLSCVSNPQNVLILGGGDGLAVREILKYPSIRSITLVDLDPLITQLFKENTTLTQLNDGSLSNPKVSVINADGFTWLRENKQFFDFIVVDFPDPSNFSLGKLYTQTFYKLLHKALRDTGVAVVQSTSPYVARKSFWCIVHTLESSGLYVRPYQAYVPAFGTWGFVLASKSSQHSLGILPKELKFLTPEMIPTLFAFSSDTSEIETEINRLNNQILVRYFEKEWGEYLY